MHIRDKIEAALHFDWQETQRLRDIERRDREEKLQGLYGKKAPLSRHLALSQAVFCVRWSGYELLSNQLGVKAVQPSIEGMNIMVMGSSFHYGLGRKLSRLLPGEREKTLSSEEVGIRADYVYRNPNTDKIQVWEVKTVGDFPFRCQTREKLHPRLREIKGIRSCQPEHRDQALVAAARLHQQGEKVESISVISVNRNTGEMNFFIEPWDAYARYDAGQVLGRIRAAHLAVERGLLPEATVRSGYVCEKICPWSLHCETGQKPAAERVRKESKRKPQWVYNRLRAEAAARVGGPSQPEITGFGDLLKQTNLEFSSN